MGAHCASTGGSNEMCQRRQGPDGTSKWGLFLRTGQTQETRTGTQPDSFAKVGEEKQRQHWMGKRESVYTSVSLAHSHSSMPNMCCHTERAEATLKGGSQGVCVIKMGICLHAYIVVGICHLGPDLCYIIMAKSQIEDFRTMFQYCILREPLHMLYAKSGSQM